VIFRKNSAFVLLRLFLQITSCAFVIILCIYHFCAFATISCK
jgi:hypothetical protein